ncbi:hypothetical protein GMST_16000 [Geomonas silvestris]|uniref:histidine kinase n=1 Tax=Geomonas silvestris TaxID=2740184 RepID=A0A6V8MH28_9BACT|nr:PAS domain S-box protein [Geomonas silvestris]GFO59275.1 hypothetical protein GMST_16000 [Geomonas silvestris]
MPRSLKITAAFSLTLLALMSLLSFLLMGTFRGPLRESVGQQQFSLALGIVSVLLASVPVLLLIFGHLKNEVLRRAAAEEYANLLLESARDGVIGTDLAGRIRFANRAAVRLLGYQSAAELLGQDLHQSVLKPAADAAPYSAQNSPILACAAGAGCWQVDQDSFTRGDGSALPVQYRCTPVLREGSCDGVLITFNDLSARRATEERLRVQEAALKAATVGIVIADAAGGILFANPAFSTIAGAPEQELLKGNLGMLRTEGLPPEHQRELWDTVRAGRSWHSEWTGKGPRGVSSSEAVTVTPLFAPDGTLSHLVGIYQDLSPLKKAEAAARESREELGQALVAAGSALWQWHPETGRLSPDERWITLIGYRPDELPATPYEFWRTLCHPEDLERLEEALHGLHGERAPLALEVRLRHRAGHYLWVAVNARWLAGPPARVSGMVLEISTRKRFEAELSRKNVELEATRGQLGDALESVGRLAQQSEQANAARSRFLASVGQELRTPLHGILASCHLLEGTRLATKQTGYLQSVTSSAESLLRTISDILDFAEIEAGQLGLARVEYSLPDQVRELGDRFQPHARQKGLKLQLRLDPALPEHLLGDPLRLSQVLGHLLSNAVKFTRHGSVSLEGALVHAVGDPDQVCFTVRDTGLGIPDREQPLLFHPFGQADGSGRRSLGGTGLGLAISRALSVLMGGELRCESVPGVGSSFTLSFPCLPAEGEAPAAEPPVPEYRFAGERVLVVEQNKINRTIAQQVLKGAAGSASASSQESPALDLVCGIRQIGGSRELYADLLHRFVDEYRDSATRLAAERERGDLAGAALIAHSVKGVAGVLAAVPLQQAAGCLERALTQGAPELAGYLERFERELEEVLQAVPKVTAEAA